MPVTDDDIGRILGRIEANLIALGESSKRQEGAMYSLDKKLNDRVDGHEGRLRELEVANPKKTNETVTDHEKRIRALEHGSAKAGMIGGIGSGIGVAVVIEIVKNKLGL